MRILTEQGKVPTHLWDGEVVATPKAVISVKG